MTFRNLSIVAVAFAVAGSAQAVFAAPVFWSMPSGSTAQIVYSDGQSDNGFYGNPIVSGSTFLFSQPSGFTATSANGSAATTSDRESFKVSSVSGADLKTVVVSETGDWSILGVIGAVKVSGLAFFTDLSASHLGTVSATPTVSYTDTEHNITYSGAAHPTTDGSGSFVRNLTYTLPAGFKSIQFAMDNILQATSTTGTTSFIQKKVVSVTFGGTLPEPASLASIAVGGMALLRRRRAV